MTSRTPIKPLCKSAVCLDGFRMSIQGSRNHYCEPREDWPASGYSALEVGFPSEPHDLLTPYAEDPRDLTGTVYAGVPASVVKEVLQSHGGLLSVTPLPPLDC